MISQAEVYGAVRDAVSAAGASAVYYQQTADEVPTDQWGRILPYVILALRVPRGLEDRPVSEADLLDARIFRLQTQCVAATPEVLMDMTDAISVALTDLRIGGGVLRRAGDEEPTDPYLVDTEVHPYRPYAPMFWRIAAQ